MTTDFYAGDSGVRVKIRTSTVEVAEDGTESLIVDGRDITSAEIQARAPDGSITSWPCTTIDAVEESITAVHVTDGILNAIAGLYVLRARYFVDSVEALSSQEVVVNVRPARTGPSPELPPPYDGMQAEIDSIGTRVDALEARPWAPRPALLSASVDPSQLDRVTALYNMAVVHPSVAGVTLPGTGRTVTGIASGDTTTSPIYQLDDDLDQAQDAGELLTIANANGVRSAFGAAAAAGTVPLVFGMNRSARVHLVLSQSNGVAEPHGPQKGYGADRAQLGADVLAINLAGAIVPAVSGGANVRINTDGTGTGTGPGLGLKFARFARRLATALGQSVTICALGRTGKGEPYHKKTSVELAYLGEVGDNTQDATRNEYQLAQSLLSTAGLTPDVIHVEWGEAQGAETKASFKPKRAAYIADLHADWPLASIVLHTPVAAPVTGATQYDGVREADAELASELDYVYLYDAAPLAASQTADVISDMRETSADPTGVHWSQDGFVRNGDAFFEWYRNQTAPTWTPMDAPSVGALRHWAEKRSVQAPSSITAWPDHITGLAGNSLTPLGADPDAPQHVPFLADLNNRPAILFSATTKALGVGAVAITDNDLLTMIVVLYPSDVVTANQFVVSAYNSTVTGARLGLQLVNPSGGMMSMHGVGGTDYSFGAGAAPLAVPQVLGLVHGASDVRLYRAGNGAIGQVGIALVYGVSGFPAQQNFGTAVDLAVGANATDFVSGNFRGHVAKILLFNAELSSPQVQAKMASLAREHGIGIGS